MGFFEQASEILAIRTRRRQTADVAEKRIRGQSISKVRILVGDCLQRLKDLPDGSVHCVVTSPPYYGLRDYGTATWEGGDPNCEHVTGSRRPDTLAPNAIKAGVHPGCDASRCRKCGARRIDQQVGLERTPEEYVQRLVEVFREVRRVLRDDGTLWLNLGDSYASTPAGNKIPSGISQTTKKRSKVELGTFNTQAKGFGACKQKDLIGITWMAAFALRADGWYLRKDIIWHKPNPMPESVEDRPTAAHEYVFLLTKRPDYFYDYDAIAEPAKMEPGPTWQERKAAGARSAKVVPGVFAGTQRAVHGEGVSHNLTAQSCLRNARSVWSIGVEPFSGAHFATMPTALAAKCIKAGTSEKGCCAKCGAPLRRVLERTKMEIEKSDRYLGQERHRTAATGKVIALPTRRTLGWEPSCKCDAGTANCVVLDPFGGAGTTGLVADRLGHDAILLELNPEYANMARDTIRADGGKVEVL